MDITGVTAGSWRISSQGTWLNSNLNSAYMPVAAGETKRISLTFTTNAGAKGAFYLLRQTPSVASTVLVSNVLFEESPTANAYYDGSSAGNELTQYVWAGTPGNSLSRMETRTIASGTGQVWAPGVQPENATLPSGITWEQVAADLQEVKS